MRKNLPFPLKDGRDGVACFSWVTLTNSVLSPYTHTLPCSSSRAPTLSNNRVHPPAPLRICSFVHSIAALCALYHTQHRGDSSLRPPFQWKIREQTNNPHTREILSGAFQEGNYCLSTPMQSAFSFLGEYLGEVGARECSGEVIQEYSPEAGIRRLQVLHDGNGARAFH